MGIKWVQNTGSIVSRTRCSVSSRRCEASSGTVHRRAGTYASVAVFGPRLSVASLKRCAASGARYRQAMNMRAAEAIVSKAPKAMKIFPISEV
jgi:hypothetical protein